MKDNEMIRLYFIILGGIAICMLLLMVLGCSTLLPSMPGGNAVQCPPGYVNIGGSCFIPGGVPPSLYALTKGK